MDGGRTNDFYELLRSIDEATIDNDFWRDALANVSHGPYSVHGLHLAILVQPYLQYILDGAKTVESRFSMYRIPPFGKVHEGDIVLLKQTGGPICGMCTIRQVWYYRIDVKSWREIRGRFTQALCAEDPAFWEARRKAEYATLMRIDNATRLPPIRIKKNDRRGWVVLAPRSEQTALYDHHSTAACFTGKTGSGKTTLAKQVAEILEANYVSLGDFVRREAIQRGAEPSRHNLQRVGESLIAEGWEKFCGAALTQSGWSPGRPLVVDGLRHVEALRAIRAIIDPSTVRLVYVAIEDSVRFRRLHMRDDATELSNMNEDAYSTEEQVSHLLRPMADLVVDGSNELLGLALEVASWLRGPPEKTTTEVTAKKVFE